MRKIYEKQKVKEIRRRKIKKIHLLTNGQSEQMFNYFIKDSENKKEI